MSDSHGGNGPVAFPDDSDSPDGLLFEANSLRLIVLRKARHGTGSEIDHAVIHHHALDQDVVVPAAKLDVIADAGRNRWGHPFGD